MAERHVTHGPKKSDLDYNLCANPCQNGSPITTLQGWTGTALSTPVQTLAPSAEGFQFDARGILGITYYSNTVPNDRNLEFDPKKHLFPAIVPGANVNAP